MNKINFCAKYLNSGTVKKRNSEFDSFKTQTVSFCELDTHNFREVKNIRKLSELWEKNEYLDTILSSLNWVSQRSECSEKFFILTEQLSDFDDINPQKILGIIDAYERTSKKLELDYLQVAPHAIHVNQKEQVFYKNCGSEMLSSLKKIYNTIFLCPKNDANTKLFYKYNDFKPSWLEFNVLIWKKGTLTRLINFMRNKV